MTRKREILGSVVWASAERWGRYILGFLVYLALARLLAPEAFGLVALAGVYIGFMDLIMSQGFGTAIVQRRDLKPAHLDTAFWISVGTGAGLWLVTAIAAGPIARAAGSPDLAPVLRWLALALPLSSLASVPTAELTRRMRFRALAVRATLSIVVGGACGLALALAGLGVWSLVGQQLVGAGVGVIALWAATDWRPGRRLSRAAFRDLFGFSAGVLGTNVLWFLSQRIDQLVIGVGLGPVALGVYFLGHRLLTLLLELMASPLQAVALPWLSRVSDDADRLCDSFLRATRMASVVAQPVFLGLATVAGPLTVLLFGAKWATAGPVVAALSVAAALRTPQSFASTALLARGRSWVNLVVLAAQAGASILCVLIGLRWGIAGVAWSVAVAAGVGAGLNAIALRRWAGIPARRLLGAIAGPTIAAATMAGLVLVVQSALPASVADPVFVIISVAVGVLAYAVVAPIVAGAAVRDCFDAAGEMIGPLRTRFNSGSESAGEPVSDSIPVPAMDPSPEAVRVT